MTEPTEQTKANGAERQLSELAAQAARHGDADGMLRALFAGRMVDWLFWRISGLYASLPPEDVRDCVAEAIGDTYRALVGGARIHSLPGYLVKAASGNALDMLSARRNERPADMDRLIDVSDPAMNAIRDATQDQLRSEALKKARELLPRLGMDNIRRVMEVVFEAVEKQLTDLRDEDIAIATDLSPETVRRLKNRGFERLRRLAQEQGYDLTRYERAICVAETIQLDEEGSDENE